MKKIFVTGGTGFIGRNLMEQLEGKYEIAAPVSDELDLLDAEKVLVYLKKHNFDVIIHTATWNATRTSSKDTSLVLENNLKMFFNIAHCNNYYGKMIYYGSGAEYDKCYYIPKMSETYFDTHIPIDSYGFSKYIMTKYAEYFQNIYNLRLFGVFGKYEDWRIRFISNVCCKVVMDLPITIKQNVFFDYMYIDDLVKVTAWFIENTSEKIYNVCTGKTYDLLTLAKEVLSVSKKNIEIRVAFNGLGVEYSGDNGKLLATIPELMFTPVHGAIYYLYNWYESNKHLLNKQLLFVDK